jgi:hypothetical protein
MLQRHGYGCAVWLSGQLGNVIGTLKHPDALSL